MVLSGCAAAPLAPGEALGLWPVPATPPGLTSPAAHACAGTARVEGGGGSVNQQGQTGRGGFLGKSVYLQGHTSPRSVRVLGGVWGGAQNHPIAWGDMGGGAKSGTAVMVLAWGTGDTGRRLRGRELGLPGNMCIQGTGQRKRRGRRDRD